MVAEITPIPNPSTERLLAEVRGHLVSATTLIWQLGHLSYITAPEWRDRVEREIRLNSLCAQLAGIDKRVPTANIVDGLKSALPILEAFLRDASGGG